MSDQRTSERRVAQADVATERRHGERRMYRQGCHCTPCRAAEAAYRAHLRLRHAHGAEVLGALVDADLTWQLLRLLRPDYFGYGALAFALGLRTPRIQFGRKRVRRSTEQRVQQEFRRVS